jgi:hypothetical protein
LRGGFAKGSTHLQDQLPARVNVRGAGSIEGRDNNPSDRDARGIDAAWIGPRRMLQAAQDDGYENENSDPGADDTLRAHVRGLLLSGDVGQKRPMISVQTRNAASRQNEQSQGKAALPPGRPSDLARC